MQELRDRAEYLQQVVAGYRRRERELIALVEQLRQENSRLQLQIAEQHHEVISNQTSRRENINANCQAGRKKQQNMHVSPQIKSRPISPSPSQTKGGGAAGKGEREKYLIINNKYRESEAKQCGTWAKEQRRRSMAELSNASKMRSNYMYTEECTDQAVICKRGSLQNERTGLEISVKQGEQLQRNNKGQTRETKCNENLLKESWNSKMLIELLRDPIGDGEIVVQINKFLSEQCTQPTSPREIEGDEDSYGSKQRRDEENAEVSNERNRKINNRAYL